MTKSLSLRFQTRSDKIEKPGSAVTENTEAYNLRLKKQNHTSYFNIMQQKQRCCMISFSVTVQLNYTFLHILCKNTWPLGYKTFFLMLNSVETKIYSGFITGVGDLYKKDQLFLATVTTPFIQIQQTRKGLLNADINNCIAGIHKVRKHQHIAYKLFLYKMCLCRAAADWFILKMVPYHSKSFV